MTKLQQKFQNLPVSSFLPEICSILKEHRNCIVSAAPGAGKTMLVPVAVKASFPGKVLLVEPRRIAAKGAAAGIAAMQEWTLGKEAGFKVRNESMLSTDTGIVAVTCGMLLNILQSDPELNGFEAVIFDEFHELGAEQELAFALLNEVREALRDDLKVVIMSATLDDETLQKLASYPLVRVPGREFPVEISRREISSEFHALPSECAKAVLQVYNHTQTGDILLFLPGKNEIDRCEAMLTTALPDAVIMKLHGAMPLSEQSRVLRPLSNSQRKIVLATNIAESSLTIEGVTHVIDSGCERRMRFVPGMGMPVLELCRITRASAAQRAGRAGRTAPGTALKLWSSQEEMGFPARLIPEIVSCDLCRTVLEIARWGSSCRNLNWLTPPPESGVNAAINTLFALGLLDEKNNLTKAGAEAAVLPVHPRLSAMLIFARKHNCLHLGCEIAAVIEEGIALKQRNNRSCDIRDLLRECRKDARRFPGFRQSLSRLLDSFNCRSSNSDNDDMAGVLIALAYPEYIGRSRALHSNRYLLTGGRTAAINEDDELRKEEFLAIAGVSMVSGRDAAVNLAAPLTLDEIEQYFKPHFTFEEELTFDENSGRVSGVKLCKFGSMVISSTPFNPDPSLIGNAVLTSALRRNIEIIAPDSAASRFLERVRFARRNGDDTLPDWDEENFKRLLPELAEPYLNKVKNFNSLKQLNFFDILKNALDYAALTALNSSCPDKYLTPAGQEIAIDYSGEQPTLQVPIQQLYGETVHPCVGKNRLPLRLELLSPARRPVQITCDLPGFWRGSWSLVRTEMRSRYPKHDWPEHPETVAARRSSVKKR